MVVSSSSAFSEYGAFSPRKSKKESNSFLLSLSALLALLAKKTSKLKRKSYSKESTESNFQIQLRSSPKSPLARPKQLLSTISNKAITLVHQQYHKRKNDHQSQEWGDGGVWQKTIMMGDKCEPLDFSGVIYYDGKGNQIEELPIKSPRASPLPGYLIRY